MGDFERDGFLIVENLFSNEEVRRLKGEVRRILGEVKDEREIRTGVYVGLAARSRLFKDLARDARLVDPLEQIIGPNIAFFSDKIVFKDAETDFGSPWHQDWPYWKGSHKISIWIALDDATSENGCLRVIPGSHREHAVHAGDASDGKGFGNRIRPEDIDENKAITVELSAGSALFFHDLTLHASHQNTSGADRWALISTYRDAMAEDPEYSFAVAAEVVRGFGHTAGPNPAKTG